MSKKGEKRRTLDMRNAQFAQAYLCVVQNSLFLFSLDCH